VGGAEWGRGWGVIRGVDSVGGVIAWVGAWGEGGEGVARDVAGLLLTGNTTPDRWTPWGCL
jgi:hypothetical protein